MSRASAIRIAFAVLAIGFFATPIAARVVGITAERFENRRLAEAPRLSQGWGAFQQTSRYLVDHMPLRAQAVRANTRIWTDVFGTDPDYEGSRALASDRALPFAGRLESGEGSARRAKTPSGDAPTSAQPVTGIVSGRKGWVYFGYEFSAACMATVSDSVTLQRFGALVRTIRATGRDAEMFVVPDKSSAYPEHLPDSYQLEHCAPAAKERLWQILARDGPLAGITELRSKLQKRKRTTREDLYQRTDTHWTTLGSLTLVKAALEAIGPRVRLERTDIRRRRAVAYTGDLSAASGNPEKDRRNEHAIVRAAGAPRVPGRTLLICDSFVYEWLRVFKPYFENIRHVSWYSDAYTIADEIERSDTVILEIVESSFKNPVYGKLATSTARLLTDR